MVASLFGENDFENEVFYRKKTSVLWELGTLQVDDVAGQGASAVIKTLNCDDVQIMSGSAREMSAWRPW